jgi:hypothetical protein
MKIAYNILSGNIGPVQDYGKNSNDISKGGFEYLSNC